MCETEQQWPSSHVIAVASVTALLHIAALWVRAAQCDRGEEEERTKESRCVSAERIDPKLNHTHVSLQMELSQFHKTNNRLKNSTLTRTNVTFVRQKKKSLTQKSLVSECMNE